MDQRSNNLPAHLPSLIGRQEALEDVRSKLLEAERGILTLTGTGGSGKTRLALAVATNLLDWAGFPDGVWMAEFAPLGDPILVPGVVASSIGIKEQSGRPIRDTVLEELRSRSLLLLLDNCEHLVETCASLADDLLRASPGLRILATSREPLRIAGERVWRVPPLAAPDARMAVSVDELAENAAVKLFVERAQSVQSALALTADTSPAIAGICARLDGLPLAIELAAAWARVLTPDQIQARLDDAFRLLVGGSRTAPTRQQTLRATLDWSYLLLSAADQERFERLAVFAGGFDLDAAGAIWSDDATNLGTDDLDMLTGLVDRSLVTPQTQLGRMRYRVLEPVRQYAQDRLSERGAWDATRRRHARYFLQIVERAEEGLKGADAEAWRARLELEQDNVRAVLRGCLDTSEAEIALRICSALRNFWLQFGYRNEGRRWVDDALRIESDVPPAVRVNGLQTAALMAFTVGDFRAARPHFEEVAEYCRGIGDNAGLGGALVYYGRTLAATAETPAEYAQGKALMQEAVRLNREAGTLWWVHNALLFLGISAWEHAELDLAAISLGEAEAILIQLGDTHSHSHLLSKLGAVRRDQGDPLSQRERQVLALLARGYTNRQIAAELIISGRTADGHVAHILAKLGLTTRAQAAVWAVEHQQAAPI